MVEHENNQGEGTGNREQFIDDRTRWAAARTRLAEERTFNTWLRSGLGMMAFALGIARYLTFDPAWLSDLMTLAFFLIGALMIILGYRTYHQSVSLFEDEVSSRVPKWLAGAVVLLVILFIALILLFVSITY